MALLDRMSASLRKSIASRTLTAAERANLRAAVAIPAVYTASLGGHAQLLGRPTPMRPRRTFRLPRVRALFG